MKLPGNQETTAKIILHLDHQPPQYRLSSDLARILGMSGRAETRACILMQIWQYIKVNNDYNHLIHIRSISFKILKIGKLLLIILF